MTAVTEHLFNLALGVAGVAIARFDAAELRATLTDVPPRNVNRDGFLESDRIRTLDLPQDGRLLPLANPSTWQ